MNRVVKSVIAGILFMGCINVMAQQRPQYTQYVLNNYIINPAVAGIENYWDVKASYRNQWAGLDGAPVTTYFTIHGPLNVDDYGRETATTFHPPGVNPRGEAYWEDYVAPKAHHGIGLTIINDKTGPLNRFSACGTYAYHVGLAPQTTLSAGFSIGVQNMSLNTSRLGSTVTGIDPAVLARGSALNDVQPDVNAGLWLYSRDYFIGLACQNVFSDKLSYVDNKVSSDGGRLLPHFFLSAGYRFFINEDISCLPSTMVKYVTPSPISFDLNCKFQYQDVIWAGVSYRINDGFATMLGFNLNSNINLSYSYDITTNKLNTVSKGTHEIMLGFTLNNKFGDSCPRNIW
jgi:type IX secretion system PorP/SprF family membrane protein